MFLQWNQKYFYVIHPKVSLQQDKNAVILLKAMYSGIIVCTLAKLYSVETTQAKIT
jgi:hypothetical protein